MDLPLTEGFRASMLQVPTYLMAGEGLEKATSMSPFSATSSR
jgi:hypothetical protein